MVHPQINSPTVNMAGDPPRLFPFRCLTVILVFACLGLASSIYLLFPNRTNVLILGIDETPEGTTLGRSDTIILTSMNPFKPYWGMLSIPRDLWVTIPGVGENRINTAHYFAEIDNPGGGPLAALETVRLNFGIDVDYYVRLKFEGFQQIVDVLGGVEVELMEPTAGYSAGKHIFDRDHALFFVRYRQETDDFFRMRQGQIILVAILRQIINPGYWPHLPEFINATNQFVDTNVPILLWPRIMVALLRVDPEGIDNRTISREMVTPFTTTAGGQVLAPNWAMINPLIEEMFGN